MKTTTLKAFIGTFALASALSLAPSAAFAKMVSMDANGNIFLSNVQVTAVTGNTISGFLNFKNTQAPVTVVTDASTTVQTGNGTANTNASIKIGDMLSISGFITGINNSITLTANKIRNTSSYISLRIKSGTVQSINTTNGSFVLVTNDSKKNPKTVTVVTNANTAFYVDNNRATSTLASTVTLNAKLHVQGTMNADGTVLTASKVTLKNSSKMSIDKKENKKDHDDDKKFGWGFGKHD